MPVATNRYFVDHDNGTDSVAGVANGRDPFGFSCVNGTYDHTGGAAERLLTSTGSFSGYTWQSGDTIYLLNAAGGITDGLYEIASKESDDAIALSTDSGLTSDSTADVDSADAPLATPQYAFDNVMAVGVDIYLMNVSDYEPTATTDIDQSISATTDNPVWVLGADDRGVAYTPGSGSMFQWSGASLPASTSLLTTKSPVNLHIVFLCIRFTGATQYSLAHNSNICFIEFKHCRLDGATSHGIYSISSSGRITLTYTELDTHGGLGMSVNAAGRGNLRAFRSKIHDNTSGGIKTGGDAGDMTVEHCQFYDDGGNELECLSTGGSVRHNTFYGGDAHALVLHDATVTVEHNSFSGFAATGAKGIDFAGGLASASGRLLYADYNHFHGNDTAPDAAAGPNDVSGDPTFVSTTDGSEDFTPDTGSPLIAAGFETNTVIGALAPVAGGGGGGNQGISQGLHTIESGVVA